MTMIRTASIGAALLAVAAFIPATGAFAAPDAAHGRKVYVQAGCALCHGTDGQGGGTMRPRLAPNPLPAEAIQGVLRSPGPQMPRYSAKLVSNKDVEDIAAYLRTIPPAKTVDQIPLLARPRR